jgi:hypothetical protein
VYEIGTFTKNRASDCCRNVLCTNEMTPYVARDHRGVVANQMLRDNIKNAVAILCIIWDTV